MVGQVTFRRSHSERVSMHLRKRLDVAGLANSTPHPVRVLYPPATLDSLAEISHSLSCEIIVTECATAFHRLCCCSTTRSVLKVEDMDLYFWGLLRALCRMRMAFASPTSFPHTSLWSIQTCVEPPTHQELKARRHRLEAV